MDNEKVLEDYGVCKNYAEAFDYDLVLVVVGL